MPPDDTEKPRQEMDPNFKPLGPKLPEGWVCLQEGESLRRGEVGAAWNHRVEWFQFTCFDEELRAVKGVAPLARKERPVQRAVENRLQIFGACGAPYIEDLGRWFPRRKSPRPPNPEKQAAAAAKRERRARRNKEGV